MPNLSLTSFHFEKAKAIRMTKLMTNRNKQLRIEWLPPRTDDIVEVLSSEAILHEENSVIIWDPKDALKSTARAVTDLSQGN